MKGQVNPSTSKKRTGVWYFSMKEVESAFLWVDRTEVVILKFLF